jgi:hypothetical protein
MSRQPSLSHRIGAPHGSRMISLAAGAESVAASDCEDSSLGVLIMLKTNPSSLNWMFDHTLRRLVNS